MKRTLTDCEYQLLDDVLARLIDAKINGAPVTQEHLVLIVTLQDELHEHQIAQRDEDDADVAYCAVCGKSWGSRRVTHHGRPARYAVDREDGIDWPIWVCTCGCGSSGARWLP